ncbi:MAG: hypothetical protein KGN36_03305 [Acidobacteriota bacterium]|nr:hypothetical protein [Acidobacteriota bacterium]
MSVLQNGRHPSGRRAVTGPGHQAEPIRLYGWDSRSGTWHGPSEPCPDAVNKGLLRGLDSASGKSWFGSVTCSPARGLSARFFVLVHDLHDCGVAAIYCDESKTGPAEIVAVMPAARRRFRRDDFAFEFLAFARFLGSMPENAALQVHDAIESALAEATAAETVAFSIGSGLWPGDFDCELSTCVEKVAVTMCRWLDHAPVVEWQAGKRSSTAA